MFHKCTDTDRRSGRSSENQLDSFLEQLEAGQVLCQIKDNKNLFFQILLCLKTISNLKYGYVTQNASNDEKSQLH